MCRKYLMTLKQERTINNKGKRKKMVMQGISVKC